jgi:hypothetical protein
LIGGIESDGSVIGEVDPDGRTVFEGPQLFKALGSLERRGGKSNEMMEEVGPVSVEAEVPVGG